MRNLTTDSRPPRRVWDQYERAEKELFARLEGFGREIENRVTGNDSSRLKDQGLKAECTSAADYASSERQEAFAASLATTGANENQVRGRLAAERSEATHPSGAVTMGKGAAKAKKTRTGAALGAERTKGGPPGSASTGRHTNAKKGRPPMAISPSRVLNTSCACYLRFFFPRLPRNLTVLRRALGGSLENVILRLRSGAMSTA